MKCGNCGKDIGYNEKFCPFCGTSVTSQNKNTLSIVIIIVVVMIFAISISMIFFIRGFIKNDIDKLPTEEKVEEKTKLESNVYVAYPKPERKYVQVNKDTKVVASKESDLNSNIEILDVHMVKGANGGIDTNGNEFGDYILVYGKNNNNVPVTIEVNLDLYDSENYKVKNKYESANAVKANKEFVIKISSELKADDDVVDYKMSYNAKKIESYYTDLDVTKNDFNFTLEKKEYKYSNSVEAEGKITNKTKHNIYALSILVKYYRGGKLVFTDGRTIFDVAANKEKDFSLYDWNLNDKDFDYDKYDFEIVSAYLYETKSW